MRASLQDSWLRAALGTAINPKVNGISASVTEDLFVSTSRTSIHTKNTQVGDSIKKYGESLFNVSMGILKNLELVRCCGKVIG